MADEYAVFATLADYQAREAQYRLALGIPIVPTDAKTGRLVPHKTWAFTTRALPEPERHPNGADLRVYAPVPRRYDRRGLTIRNKTQFLADGFDDPDKPGLR